MLKKQIIVGSLYRAKVSDKVVTVRVDNIRESGGFSGRTTTIYEVTNLETNRKTQFRSAQKFRGLATIDDPHHRQPQPTQTEQPRGLSLGRRDETPSAPNLIVTARAGTGKTTTLIEGLRRIKGLPTSITPSPQQAAIWEVMAMGSQPNSVCFVAFNKAIADELVKRVPEGYTAMTLHSMGFRAVQSAFGRVGVDNYRVENIISELTHRDIRDLRRDEPEMLAATKQLVGLCKMNLVDATDEEELGRLASHYDVDMNGSRTKVFALVPRVLDRCKLVDNDRVIDFADMIWLPVVLNLSISRYDLLLVDEAQDLNRCQQQLAMKAGRRLILCGDPRQAIYGFAGADSESIPRMQQLMTATPNGCHVLPLTVTRRCGKKIVDEAKKIVSDFEAFESNCEGVIGKASYESDKEAAERIESTYVNGVTPEKQQLAREALGYVASVQDGDMALCRVNAPLVSQCFRLIRQGRKASIQGRDVGQGLISTVRKLAKKSDLGSPEGLVDFVSALDDWYTAETRKENAKRNPSEMKLIALQDRRDCLMCFTEGAKNLNDVISKIESIFTDDRDNPGVRFSSIHKAKGLEAKRVFLLEPKGATVPHPMARSAWQKEQEMNLRYVAITRAIEELVYVS